jgi:hypothetical protein
MGTSSVSVRTTHPCTTNLFSDDKVLDLQQRQQRVILPALPICLLPALASALIAYAIKSVFAQQ